MCAYCGVKRGLTKDHVIPKCLFKRPLPSNMITVPACSECNNAKSKDEDYLRDMLVIDHFTSSNPTAQTLLNNKVIRSATEGSSKVALAVCRRKPERSKISLKIAVLTP